MAKPLSEVKLAEDETLLDGFQAIIGGETVTITAVLERTCVYVTATGDRKLAGKAELMVEPEGLPIRRRKLG